MAWDSRMKSWALSPWSDVVALARTGAFSWVGELMRTHHCDSPGAPRSWPDRRAESALAGRLRDVAVRGTLVVGATKEANVGYRIDCADGMTVRGETMEELRTKAEQHVAEHHQGEDLDFEAVMATTKEE